ncbi:DUF4145 domain-containing protein [Clostridium baratii]|uniref:DUF4145 domain-containing protein n=1 Tax=Clostridium baratii TaxID=1561 RepID=UPI0030D0AD1F
MEKISYISPKIGVEAFTCPICNIISQQIWSYQRFYKVHDSYTKEISFVNIGCTDYVEISISTCKCCGNPHIWIGDKMVQPSDSNVSLPNDDMPEKVKEIYNEARDVFPASPKASAALLRLALQYLCIELGEKGRNINTDIGEMVKKGLPVEVQQALDIVRVVGNNAVHPGELDLNDDKEVARTLFNIVNFIVDNRIVQPKKIKEFYNSLPKGALDGIKNRDK